MLAFHNDKKIQAKYVNRLEEHYDADEIIKGVYWEHGKGCAVGCTLHSSDHFAFEGELGVPVQIAQLMDAIFEALPNGAAKDFPLAVLTSIPLGADLSGVWPEFAAWMMTDETFGVEHTTNDPEIKELCREVARRYRARETTGPEASALADKLRAARVARVAWDAWAAWAAWAARVAWAARDAWDAWVARAAWDAWDARDARVARAARDAFARASADELLRLLAVAPVGKKAGV